LHTGVTQEHLIQQFRVKGAASIRTATLIDKSSERRVPLEPEFVGFKVDGPMMVGYGMGAGKRYRNLPYIARMAPKTAAG
jgi:hypoxanthine-guanine phosphoribosyltransferase